MIGTQTLAQQAHPKAPRAPQASSLTGHPHFAAALTLWFAALFSLSTLAVRGALLESWVMAARVDLLLPAAAPPLGLKARLLLAVTFALVGAAIGWLAARMLRPAPAGDGDDFQLRQRDRHPDAPARRPISAHAELGDEGLGRPDSDYAQRVEDMPSFHAAASDPFLTTPPLARFPAQPQEEAAPAARPFAAASPAEPALSQGTAPVFTIPLQAEPIVTAKAAPPPSPARESEEPADPFDLPTIDFMTQDPPRNLYVAASTPPEASAEEEEAKEDSAEDQAEAEAGDEVWHTLPPVVSETDLNPSLASHGLSALPPMASVTPLRAVVSQSPAPAATPAASQPIPRPERHLAVVSPLPTPAKPAADKPASEQPAPSISAAPAAQEAPAMIGATPVQPRANAGERIAHAPLGDLSHVELIERLAMAIHTREKSAQADAQDMPDEEDGEEDAGGTQAILRSALASLREVK